MTSLLEDIVLLAERGKKDRELLIELSMPKFKDSTLDYAVNSRVADLRDGDAARSAIAQKIRKHLKENP